MTDRASITAEDKIAVIKREIALRLLVYPRRVSEGKMKPDKADFEIKVMQEILADYRGLNQKEVEAGVEAMQKSMSWKK